MKTAAVSELKASLSEFLDRVRAGEEIVVTDRGRPIARLVPLGGDDLPFPAHLRALERAGLVRIPKGRIPREFWTARRPRDTEGRALAALLRDRQEGR
jgi:prevent-host-death family protein